MNTLVSFFQQSKLIENAYKSLMDAIHGTESLQSNRETQEDAGYHNAFFAAQTWSFVQTRQTPEEPRR